MNSYQVLWNVRTFPATSEIYLTMRRGEFRVTGENLAQAEKNAAGILLHDYAQKDYLNRIQFTVRGKELSRFEVAPWLLLSDYMTGGPKELYLSSPVAENDYMVHKEKLVFGILGITFSGIALINSWLPIAGLVFAIVGVIFTILAWKFHHKKILTIIATVLTPIAFVVSLIFYDSLVGLVDFLEGIPINESF